MARSECGALHSAVGRNCFIAPLRRPARRIRLWEAVNQRGAMRYAYCALHWPPHIPVHIRQRQLQPRRVELDAALAHDARENGLAGSARVVENEWLHGIDN